MLAESILRGLIPDYERKRCETLAVIEKYLSEDRYKRSKRFKRISQWISKRLTDSKYCLLNVMHRRGMITETELRYVVDNTPSIKYICLTDGTEILLSSEQDTDSMRNFIEEHRTRLKPEHIIYMLLFDSEDDMRAVFHTYYGQGGADIANASRIQDVPSFMTWLESAEWQEPSDSDEESSDEEEGSDGEEEGSDGEEEAPAAEDSDSEPEEQ